MTIQGDASDEVARPGMASSRRPRGAVRDALSHVAPWTGIVVLVYVVGSVMLLQWRWAADPSVPMEPSDVGGLAGLGVACVAGGLVALGSGRVRPVVAVFALGMLFWVAARGLSAFALTGQWTADALQVALILGGLACATAAAHPTWTGWTLLALGSGYIYANLWALRRNFGSLDTAFPGAGSWVGIGPAVEGGAPAPPDCAEILTGSTSLLGELILFLGAPDGACAVDGARRWMPLGIDGNPNGTSNMIALAVVFAAPFVLHRWRREFREHTALVLFGRVTLVGLLVVPGLVLLHMLDGRAALAGAIVALAILLVPLGWAHSGGWSWAFAAGVLATIMTPFVLTRATAASFAGRSCVWTDWWAAISPTSLWGIGPPGTYPAAACGGTLTQWAHAHNELLQAWTVSGILGLALAVGVIGGLAWYAMRYSDRDDRILMSLMTCCAVLLGFEILVNIPAGWVRPNLVFFVGAAAYSLRLMSPTRDGTEPGRPQPAPWAVSTTGSRSQP